MKKPQHGITRQRKPGVGRQCGDIAPFLAAAIPALVAFCWMFQTSSKFGQR